MSSIASSINSLEELHKLNKSCSVLPSSYSLPTTLYSSTLNTPNFGSNSLLEKHQSDLTINNWQRSEKKNNQDEEDDCDSTSNLKGSQIQKKHNKKIKKMKYFVKMVQAIEYDECFLIEGDFLFYPKAFMSYLNNNHLEQSSQMNQFRPVRRVNFYDGQRMDLELDCMTESYGDINIVRGYLSKMSDSSSYQMRNYMHYYDLLIKEQQQTVNQVHDYFKNKEAELVEKLDNNFQKSLILSNQIIEELNKQNEITLYFIRRVSHKNLFKKSYSMGGTKTLLDIIFGPSATDKQALVEKLLREGVPNLIDYRGLVQYMLSSFSGEQSETIDLMTVDMFKIPCKFKIMSVPLSSIEIAPGCIVFDELLYTTYTPSNPKIIENIQQQRKDAQTHFKPSYQMGISDFSYEAKSEQFIEKYYPDVSYSLKYKRKKPENFKKSQNQTQPKLDIKIMS